MGAGPTGIEPATYGLRVRRSSLAELRARNVSFEKGFTEKYRAYGVFCCMSMSGLSLAMPSTPFFAYSATSSGLFTVQTITFKPFS